MKTEWAIKWEKKGVELLGNNKIRFSYKNGTIEEGEIVCVVNKDLSLNFPSEINEPRIAFYIPGSMTVVISPYYLTSGRSIEDVISEFGSIKS